MLTQLKRKNQGAVEVFYRKHENRIATSANSTAYRSLLDLKIKFVHCCLIVGKVGINYFWSTLMP